MAWGEAILDDLLEISLYTPHGTTTVVDLVFREDCGKDFIEEVSDGYPRVPPTSMKSYFKELGAVDTDTWDTRVGVWNSQARVDFVVSKSTFEATKQGNKIGTKAFETQYRLVER